MEANIPVVVNNNAPFAGLPPNCLTEQANLTCWNFSVYKEQSFFSGFKHTFFPEWKNAADKICSPCKIVCNDNCHSFNKWSLVLKILIQPVSSATNNNEPVKSHCKTVIREAFDNILKAKKHED